MTTTTSATTNATTGTAPVDHPVPLDNTIAGHLMGVYIFWALKAQEKVEGSTDEVNAAINLAQRRGELLSKVTEMTGLLSPETTRIRELPEPNQTRARKLLSEINPSAADLSYVQIFNADGTPRTPAPTIDGPAGPLFGDSTARQYLPATDAQKEAAVSAANQAAWGYLQQIAQRSLDETGSKGVNANIQIAVGWCIKGMEYYGYDIVNDNLGASDAQWAGMSMADMQQFGQNAAYQQIKMKAPSWADPSIKNPDGSARSWDLFRTQFFPLADDLTRIGNKDITDSVAFLKNQFNLAYQANYRTPNNGYIANCADDSFDGTRFKGIEVTLQTASSVDNQRVNQSMTRAGQLVQEANSFNSGGSEVLKIAMQTARSINNNF